MIAHPELYIHKISTKLPGDVLSNREFSFLIPPDHRPPEFTPDTAEAWIEERTGISHRFVANRSMIGTRCAPIDTELALTLETIQNFQINAHSWSELDAIIVVKSSPIQYSPALSQKLVQHFTEKFSAETPHKISEKRGIFTLDLFQPCTGILAALKILLHLPFRNAWLITPEVLTPFVNLKDPASAILFGDGIAALWITQEITQENQRAQFRLKDANFESMADHHQVLGFSDAAESGYMKGPELFRKVVPEFKKASQKLLDRNQLTVADIQYYLPHQANARIIERAAHSLGFRKDQIISNIKNVGNTANASMLIALDHFLHSNQSWKSGNKILMNACGAGLSSGAALLEVV